MSARAARSSPAETVLRVTMVGKLTRDSKGGLAVGLFNVGEPYAPLWVRFPDSKAHGPALDVDAWLRATDAEFGEAIRSIVVTQAGNDDGAAWARKHRGATALQAAGACGDAHLLRMDRGELQGADAPEYGAAFLGAALAVLEGRAT